MVSAIEEKGSIDELESRFFGKNDVPMTCVIASRAVKHEGELRIISIVHDITEKQQAETELLKYRDKLEILVEEKTLKLKEAQAELLQRELSERENAVDGFRLLELRLALADAGTVTNEHRGNGRAHHGSRGKLLRPSRIGEGKDNVVKLLVDIEGGQLDL